MFTGGVNPVNDDEPPICSAKDCRTAAVWVLAWNNPKIHPPERRKTWLACDDHREHLSQFLGMRGFLKGVVPLAQWESHAGTPAGGPATEADETTGTAGTAGTAGTGGTAEGGGSAADG
jgi:hypothetical protein